MANRVSHTTQMLQATAAGEQYILRYKPAIHCHQQMVLKEAAKGGTACPSDLAAAEGGQALPLA